VKPDEVQKKGGNSAMKGKKTSGSHDQGKKHKSMSRREFLRRTGYTAMAAGISSSLPRILKRAQAAVKDHVLVGRPLPVTGPVAAFSEPAQWLNSRAVAEMNKDGGFYIKEAGKKLPVEVKIVDTESNPTKAGDLAAKLILNDNVDLMYTSNTPATVNPVSAICERSKVPCIGTNNPPEMWLIGGPYHWSFVASVSVRDFAAAFLQAWAQVDTNKIVALCAENDPDGVAWAESSKEFLGKAGYRVIDLGRFPAGTNDYSTQISGWKGKKVEILFANMAPPDFAILWRQCYSSGFVPKICTVGRGVVFPAAVQAIGSNLGIGTSCEIGWHPLFPFKSSLGGYSARKLADDWEASTGKQWTGALGPLYSGYEIVADVLRRAQTLDKEALRKAMVETSLNTIVGHVKFNKDNVAVLPSGAQQWQKGKKWPVDAILVANGNYKILPVEGKLISIPELRKGN
jgi:branched-chain amino acid transport system substrate-binding protein